MGILDLAGYTNSKCFVLITEMQFSETIFMYHCTTFDQPFKTLLASSRSSTAFTQECCEQSWTSPGGNTPPQDTNCTATCLLSRKLFKLDEPDVQDTAGEAGTNS